MKTQNRGRLIVIEGLDGSGKGTQAKLLASTLAERGSRVLEVSFPDYKSDSSALVKMYLDGQFGTDPSDVNAYAASSFYAVDRYASFKKDWGKFYNEGGIVITDRYTTSNAIHQCSKLPEEEWSGFLRWLFHFEYELLGIPAPDLVAYLRVAPEVSQRLMSGRYHGDETKKDIHESNVDYLVKCRKAADYCAETLGWRTIQCSCGDEMRSISEIQAEITDIMVQLL
jgi:dTMP kinase